MKQKVSECKNKGNETLCNSISIADSDTKNFNIY